MMTAANNNGCASSSKLEGTNFLWLEYKASMHNRCASTLLSRADSQQKKQMPFTLLHKQIDALWTNLERLAQFTCSATPDRQLESARMVSRNIKHEMNHVQQEFNARALAAEQSLSDEEEAAKKRLEDLSTRLEESMNQSAKSRMNQMDEVKNSIQGLTLASEEQYLQTTDGVALACDLFNKKFEDQTAMSARMEELTQTVSLLESANQATSSKMFARMDALLEQVEFLKTSTLRVSELCEDLEDKVLHLMAKARKDHELLEESTSLPAGFMNNFLEVRRKDEETESTPQKEGNNEIVDTFYKTMIEKGSLSWNHRSRSANSKRTHWLCMKAELRATSRERS